MNKRRAFLKQIYARKRVDITSKKYLQKVKRFLTTGIILSIVMVATLILTLGINILSISMSFALLVVVFGLCNYLYRHIGATAIKADTLIVTSLNKRSAVTSIRSISKIKENCILGVQITKFKYFLDGRNRISVIINRDGAYPFTPAHSLRKALELSKKQKANHKPGSVAV